MYGEDYVPFFSIVIPAYQAESVIERCIRSVILQSFGNWEVILVDDGSADQTLQRVKSLGEERVRCIRVPNGGPAKARNRGISEAVGEYLLFLDADDLLEEGCLETLRQRLTGHPVDLLIFGFVLHQVQTGQVHHNYHADVSFDGVSLKQVPVTELYSRNLLNQVWNKAYRREFVVKNGLEMPDYRYGEDRLFVMDCLEKAETISVSEQELYCYRIENEDSLIHAWHDNKFEICTQIHERITELARGTADDRQSVLNYMYVKSVFSCLADACGRKSPLRGRQLLGYLRRVLHTEVLRAALKDCSCPNLPTRMVVLLMRSRSSLLSYGFIKASGCIMRFFPDAMIRWKHRRREK